MRKACAAIRHPRRASTLALREVREGLGSRVAAVIHLAGHHDFSGEANPLYRTVNVDGMRHPLQALQAVEVERFVYASTILVPAPAMPGMPIDESSRPPR